MLQNVEFVIEDKVIKRGKIRVFNTKQFFIKFRLENGGVVRDYELPYPYRVEETDNGFLFDYCLSAFVPPTEEVFWKMKAVGKENASKIHEKYLSVVTLSA